MNQLFIAGTAFNGGGKLDKRARCFTDCGGKASFKLFLFGTACGVSLFFRRRSGNFVGKLTGNAAQLLKPLI